MSPPRSPRVRTEWLVGSGLWAVTLFVFAHACWNGFVNIDDPGYAESNPHVLGGLTWDNVAWAFTTRQVSNWHPLTWLSLQLDATLFGPGPAGFHLTSVLLHATNTALLFAALRALTGAVWRSAAVAALFGLHPLHVESVAWVSERKDVLSTLFWVLTLLAYAAYVRRPGWRRYLPVVACLALGLLAKPMLVTLPCVLLLLDVWPLRRLAGTAAAPATAPAALVGEKLPLFVLVAASSVITMIAQRSALQSLEVLPVADRVMNAAVAYVRYLGLMVWPDRLAAFYPYSPRSVAPANVAGAALVLALVSGLAWRRRGTEPYLLVGWLWYLGTLVPVIGLVQVGAQALADRYTYVPLIGIFLALSWAAADLARAFRVPIRAVGALAGVLLAACAAATWVQVTYWRDGQTLWEHALEVEPDNVFALNSLGLELVSQGRTADALPYFAAALKLDPANAEAASNLGGALSDLGRCDEALPYFRRSLQREPRNALAQLNLGVTYGRLQQPDEALRWLTLAAQLEPENARIRLTLGAALAEQQRWEEASSHLQAALALNPGVRGAYFAHYLLGQAALRRGDRARARAHARAALELQPEFAPAHELLRSVDGKPGRTERPGRRAGAEAEAFVKGPAADASGRGPNC